MSVVDAIRAVALTRRFGRVSAVDGLDITVRKGELVGLVGPNGAGKSTTIKMLSAQLLPTTGSIHIDGIDVIADPNGARARIGYVPEEPALYDYLTAREMVDFVVAVRGRGDAARALRLAGLGDDADRPIQEYSQGMRRKTALACAIVSQPAVLILDEALNGLDPPSAERVVASLKAACAEGTAVILSTHVLDTLERVADRIVLIDAGKVQADLPTADLDQVRAFFRTMGERPSR